MDILVTLGMVFNYIAGTAADAANGNLLQKALPLINIPNGKIIGLPMISASGRRFLSFRGVPYALPPLGQLRFRDPVYYNKWEGVLDASKEGPYCLQYDEFFTKIMKGTEDCLKLNIYTPEMNHDKLRPVMVWLHGGSFQIGSGNGETDWYGPKYLLDKDIVLVTINYRLDIFGFLSTEDSEAPGNYGLLDQSMALRWVRENIVHFGGDPESVTLFGESAGGAGVEYQILSPRSKGLFHKAISQSGSTMCPWALFNNVGYYTQQLAKKMKCSTASSRHILDCLRSKSATHILNVKRRMVVFENFGYPMSYGPRIDVEREVPFLPQHPQQIIKQRVFNHVPYIMGVNQNEASFIVAVMLARGGSALRAFQRDPIKNLRYCLAFERRTDGAQLVQRVLDQYLDTQRSFSRQLAKMEQMFSDAHFFKCIDDSADLFRQYNEQPTFFYYYTHRGPFSLTKLLGAPSSVDLGVGHTDELFMIFHNLMVSSILSSGDKKVSKAFIDFWTSFAANGFPESDFADWQPMTSETMRHLNINAENPRLEDDAPSYHDRLWFWDQIYQYSADNYTNFA